MLSWRRFCALKKDNRGVTAIEFALLAPVFFAILLSGFEIGLLFSRITVLDHAVAQSARKIYTRSSLALTQDDLENDLCDSVGLLVSDCKNNITVELTRITNIASIPNTNAQCRDASVRINPVVQFNPGSRDEFIFMRACVTVDLLTPGLDLAIGDHLHATSSGRFQVVSSTAFMNEPF